MGAKDMVFKFNPFSLKDEKTLLENAEKLKAIGASRERIADFLTERGLTIHPDELEESVDNDKLNRDITSMGRKRMDKGTDDMNSNVDKSGVSELTEEKADDIQQRGIYSYDDEYGEDIPYMEEEDARI